MKPTALQLLQEKSNKMLPMPSYYLQADFISGRSKFKNTLTQAWFTYLHYTVVLIHSFHCYNNILLKSKLLYYNLNR